MSRERRGLPGSIERDTYFCSFPFLHPRTCFEVDVIITKHGLLNLSRNKDDQFGPDHQSRIKAVDHHPKLLLLEILAVVGYWLNSRLITKNEEGEVAYSFVFHAKHLTNFSKDRS